MKQVNSVKHKIHSSQKDPFYAGNSFELFLKRINDLLTSGSSLERVRNALVLIQQSGEGKVFWIYASESDDARQAIKAINENCF